MNASKRIETALRRTRIELDNLALVLAMDTPEEIDLRIQVMDLLDRLNEEA